MKWSFAGAAALGLGLIGLVLLILFQNITTKNEQDYYLLKEIMEASMSDAVDRTYIWGSVKINKEKFVESFIRRFSEVASFNTKGYTIEFFDIIESPPKASIRITQKSITAGQLGERYDVEFNIVNELNGMLEDDFYYSKGGI